MLMLSSLLTLNAFLVIRAHGHTSQGYVIGHLLLASAIQVVQVTCAALLVFFAKEPNTLRDSRPSEYNLLLQKWQERHKGAFPGAAGGTNGKKRRKRGFCTTH
jgi:hypothetical protein